MSFLFQGRFASLWPTFTRTLRNKALDRPIPQPTDRFPTLDVLLKSFKRDAETKVQAQSWDELWALNGVEMKKQGLSVKDRRYFLWCMEKFRQGEDPMTFAHPEKRRKKIRGRGPAVQNGKRIRSRRKQ